MSYIWDVVEEIRTMTSEACSPCNNSIVNSYVVATTKHKVYDNTSSKVLSCNDLKLELRLQLRQRLEKG